MARANVSQFRERRHQWRNRRMHRQWRYRLAPEPRDRVPKGLPRFWQRIRRVFWSWLPWAAATIVALVRDEWWWAIGWGAMAFVSYVVTPSERPPRYGLDHEFAVEDEEFLPTMIGATGVPMSDGNDVRLLENGDEFYPAMLQAVEEAELSITIEAYIYWAGEIGKRFAEALAARARAGVRVKILLDTIGSSTIGEEILKILESGGCQLGWYNPVRWYSVSRFNHRTHRKSLIIDGRIGFTGGAGIADHWQGHAQDPKHWRDTQIRIEGPGVVPLQTGFALNWLQTTGELISGGPFYPPVEPAGRLSVQTIMSSPEIGASTVRTMYYLSIVCARKTIYIANPYFVPDQAAIEALVDARKRNVDVRIMVSGIHNDNWLARQNSVRLFGTLLEAGIQILEYNRTMLHQKTMVVDGIWATVGTTNFDSRSFSHNEENNVCVYDRAFASELADKFLEDEAACDPIDLETWRSRSLWRKTQELVAALLEEQS
jgi:cardiolipin synthase